MLMLTFYQTKHITIVKDSTLSRNQRLFYRNVSQI